MLIEIWLSPGPSDSPNITKESDPGPNTQTAAKSLARWTLEQEDAVKVRVTYDGGYVEYARVGR